jgi:hypothetical protein
MNDDTMPQIKRDREIGMRSVAFYSRNPLVGFLYYLLRDSCPAGGLEDALDKLDDPPVGSWWRATKYSNGWLGRYADDFARRLKEKCGLQATQLKDERARVRQTLLCSFPGIIPAALSAVDTHSKNSPC